MGVRLLLAAPSSPLIVLFVFCPRSSTSTSTSFLAFLRFFLALALALGKVAAASSLLLLLLLLLLLVCGASSAGTAGPSSPWSPPSLLAAAWLGVVVAITLIAAWLVASSIARAAIIDVVAGRGEYKTVLDPRRRP